MAKKPNIIESINATFDEVLAAVAPKATPIYTPQDEGVVHGIELVEYTDPGNIEPIAFQLDPGTESIWATQAQMAQLFEADQSGISHHLKGIFDSGELNPESNRHASQ